MTLIGRRTLTVELAQQHLGGRVIVKVDSKEIERLTLEEARELARMLNEVQK